MVGNPSHNDSSTGKRYDEMATKRESREPQNGRKYGEEAIAQNQLEAWPNPNPERDYVIHFEIPEFTCLCPQTGQPDFATIRVRYVPDRVLVELKSIKLYIWSYRNEGAFHEDVTNRILNDFVTVSAPRWIEVVGDFSVRGGIKTVVRATHGKRPEI